MKSLQANEAARSRLLKHGQVEETKIQRMNLLIGSQGNWWKLQCYSINVLFGILQAHPMTGKSRHPEARHICAWDAILVKEPALAWRHICCMSQREWTVKKTAWRDVLANGYYPTKMSFFGDLSMNIVQYDMWYERYVSFPFSNDAGKILPLTPKDGICSV